MKIAVYGDEVQAGDVILRDYYGDVEELTIARVDRSRVEDENVVDVYNANGKSFPVGTSEICILRNRLWPEGKTKEQMQEEILHLALRLMDAGESRADGIATQLRETIEEYELGKSLVNGEGK